MAKTTAGGLQTEYEFILPRGYVDSHGTLHKKGRMRLATAMDEIAPLRDPRVRANQAYLVIILLARVITQLGTVEAIDTGVIENLFSADLSFLQDLYRRINEMNPEEEAGQEQETASVGE
ncbi:MAG: phage tail assembly protein [Fimbriimonadales bacterium]